MLDGFFGRRFFVLLGVASALGCSQISQLNAQTVELRPQARLYVPTRISFQDGVLHVRQKIGMIVGARLRVAFNDRFDLLTGVTYIPGYATIHGAGKRIEVGSGSHRLSASTGARYWLLPAAGVLAWEVHTSLGVGFGGQPAYKDLFESAVVSGIVGTTVRYQIGRIVSLLLRVQERLYRTQLGGPEPVTSGSPLQVAFGVSFPFLESARLNRADEGESTPWTRSRAPSDSP